MQVNELVFPTNFYVLEMKNDTLPNAISILLGRPFLKTAQTKIDVHDRSLTMKFDREKIRFNIFEAMRYPSDVHSVFGIYMIDKISQRILDLHVKDEIEVAISEAITSNGVEETLREDIIEVVFSIDTIHPTCNMEVSYIDLPLTYEKLLPSVQQAPTVELKPLLDHLKNAFLGDNNKLHMTIVKGLEL